MTATWTSTVNKSVGDPVSSSDRNTYIGANGNIDYLYQFIVPVGGSVTWWGPLANIPTGFHNCDGAAISRTTYSALFSLIGTTFGSGDGSTTFNLPNTLAKFIEGPANSSTGPGATGGSTTISEANLPAHSHQISGFVPSGYSSNYNGGSAGSLPMITSWYTTPYTQPDGSGTAYKPPFIDAPTIIRII